jgi:hypothetical protein
MFLTKPVSELTYEDVEALTASGEPEGIVLDYKKMISGSEHDKAELAKDICAFANSQGGYLVIGVEETNGKPVHPPCGTGRLLERQKTEEWVEQVVNSNIAQRVLMDVKAISIPNSDLCIIVVHVPMSARMPHMVTYQRDNRYYRRIFKRHQYESLPAEEYEVREMFEKGSRMVDKVVAYLASQGYGDPSSNEFAENTYTKRLGLIIYREKGLEPEIVKAGHYATFVACPNVLTDDLIDISKDELWNWLEPNSRRYPPDPGGLFLPTNKVTTLEGIVLMGEKYRIGDTRTEFIGGFLRINRNGYIELGSALANQEEADIAFAFVPMIGLFWQFLGFITDLYRVEGIHMPFKVMLNMKGTEGLLLSNLGEGWLEPYGGSGRAYRPTCIEPNIQIVRELRSPAVDELYIGELVRDVAKLVDNAWGQREARCYNHPNRDPERQLPISQMRGFFP